MATAFIYTLADPSAPREIRYVGVAEDPYLRYESHLKERGVMRLRNHRLNWLRSLQLLGVDPVLDVLDEVPRVQRWDLEREYIRVFRAIGFKLVNGTEGGEGSRGHRVGLSARGRLSQMNSGSRNPRFGRSVSLATRRRIGEALKASPKAIAQRRHAAEKRRREGFRHTEAAKIKCGAANVGRCPSAAARENMSRAQSARRLRELVTRKGGQQ